jgi:hypothetical protein
MYARTVNIRWASSLCHTAGLSSFWLLPLRGAERERRSSNAGTSPPAEHSQNKQFAPRSRGARMNFWWLFAIYAHMYIRMLFTLCHVLVYAANYTPYKRPLNSMIYSFEFQDKFRIWAFYKGVRAILFNFVCHEAKDPPTPYSSFWLLNLSILPEHHKNCCTLQNICLICLVI